MFLLIDPFKLQTSKQTKKCHQTHTPKQYIYFVYTLNPKFSYFSPKLLWKLKEWQRLSAYTCDVSFTENLPRCKSSIKSIHECRMYRSSDYAQQSLKNCYHIFLTCYARSICVSLNITYLHVVSRLMGHYNFPPV